MKYLGIDLGGTNIVAGIVDENFNIIARASCKTKVPRSGEAICDDIVNLVLQVLESADITLDAIPWVGIGCPGSVNQDTGIVEFSANLFLQNWHLVQQLESRLKKKILIENDANAAAYGEFIAGAAKNTKNSITLTLGTGIGSGIIINQKIYSASNFAGAEIGHMVIVCDGIPCACGRHGCWEAYASANGLIHLTIEALKKDTRKSSDIWRMIGGNLTAVTGRTSFDAMRAGDELGKEIVKKYIHYLSCGIVNVINIFQPDILCIGGGVSKQGETLLAPIRKYIETERYSKNAVKQTQICCATLGNNAGLIGSALLGHSCL